ncbi:MAG: hypothetical protein HQ518_19225 [Rhodopirellula sp.]|nr:hypothetical protein [Rhodopirellula sp.]
MHAQRATFQKNSRRSVLILAALAPLFLLVISGCGGSVDEGRTRFNISGTVTYDGKPVPKGTIYFNPAEGNVGPQGFAAIVNGKYNTSSEGKGTVGGHHTARIEGTDTAGLPIFVPQFEDIDLPKTATTHSFEVPASAADKLQTDAEPV